MSSPLSQTIVLCLCCGCCEVVVLAVGGVWALCVDCAPEGLKRAAWSRSHCSPNSVYTITFSTRSFWCANSWRTEGEMMAVRTERERVVVRESSRECVRAHRSGLLR